jgi:hypothetical protein
MPLAKAPLLTLVSYPFKGCRITGYVMTISKIQIENIRGFENKTLNVQILPNCTNIIVAPNGFGKSSITTAFGCAKGGRLIVEQKDKHKNDDEAESSLSIEHDGAIFRANSELNEITDKFDVHVIRSNIEPKAKLPKINGITVPRPYLEIPSLDLGPMMEKENINCDMGVFKSMFEKNAKVVPNFSVKCADEVLRIELLSAINDIDKLKQKKSSDLFDEIIGVVKVLSGTKAVISEEIEIAYAQKVVEVPQIGRILEILTKHVSESVWLERLVLCYILMELNKSDRPNLKKWLQYAAYSRRLQSLKEFIADINGAWVSAEVKESRGRVVVNFPDASSLSNGQRDLLYFGCNLMRTRDVSNAKSCIILIDEVFDYLDDANIVVAQYFLSKIIDAYRKDERQIYILLMTHLDPLYFKGYALKRQRTVYLGDATHKITETMRKLISRRDDACWADQLSKYFLHYHPDDFDISNIFNDTYKLPKKHGRSHEFYSFLKGEWDKCLAGEGEYDPFAVCVHVRVQIEKCAYSKIHEEKDREKFLQDCNGTAKKLIFADSVGVSVPEACLLLGVVYNDALHQKGQIDHSATIALKLRNLGLQSMMRQAVSW